MQQAYLETLLSTSPWKCNFLCSSMSMELLSLQINGTENRIGFSLLAFILQVPPSALCNEKQQCLCLKHTVDHNAAFSSGITAEMELIWSQAAWGKDAFLQLKISGKHTQLPLCQISESTNSYYPKWPETKSIFIFTGVCVHFIIRPGAETYSFYLLLTQDRATR